VLSRFRNSNSTEPKIYTSCKFYSLVSKFKLQCKKFENLHFLQILQSRLKVQTAVQKVWNMINAIFLSIYSIGYCTFLHSEFECRRAQKGIIRHQIPTGMIDFDHEIMGNPNNRNHHIMIYSYLGLHVLNKLDRVIIRLETAQFSSRDFWAFHMLTNKWIKDDFKFLTIFFPGPGRKLTQEGKLTWKSVIGGEEELQEKLLTDWFEKLIWKLFFFWNKLFFSEIKVVH
jgi:hypothetical protein